MTFGSKRAAVCFWLGVLSVGLVACRGVLGIHELTYDGGPDATKEAATGDDAAEDGSDDTGEPDAGHDAGSPSDAGHDVGVDTGIDAGHEAGPEAAVEAGHDAGVDAREPLDACVASCISSATGMQVPDFIGAYSAAKANGACACMACMSVCTGGMPCSPPPPPDGAPPPTTCPVCLGELAATGRCDAAIGACLGGGSCNTIATCLEHCGAP